MEKRRKKKGKTAARRANPRRDSAICASSDGTAACPTSSRRLADVRQTTAIGKGKNERKTHLLLQASTCELLDMALLQIKIGLVRWEADTESMTFPPLERSTETERLGNHRAAEKRKHGEEKKKKRETAARRADPRRDSATCASSDGTGAYPTSPVATRRREVDVSWKGRRKKTQLLSQAKDCHRSK